jgi:hypothetical protein
MTAHLEGPAQHHATMYWPSAREATAGTVTASSWRGSLPLLMPERRPSPSVSVTVTGNVTTLLPSPSVGDTGVTVPRPGRGHRCSRGQLADRELISDSTTSLRPRWRCRGWRRWRAAGPTVILRSETTHHGATSSCSGSGQVGQLGPRSSTVRAWLTAMVSSGKSPLSRWRSLALLPGSRAGRAPMRAIRLQGHAVGGRCAGSGALTEPGRGHRALVVDEVPRLGPASKVRLASRRVMRPGGAHAVSAPRDRGVGGRQDLVGRGGRRPR